MSNKMTILDPALQTPFEVVDDPSAKTWDQAIDEEAQAYQRKQRQKVARARRTQAKSVGKKAKNS